MSKQSGQTALYTSTEELPSAIRGDLPAEVQRLYLDAFNKAWTRHAEFADREPFCHRVARSAVRRQQRLLAKSGHPAGAMP